MPAKIGVRTRIGEDNYLWAEKEVDIVSALDMLDELEGRIAAPLREILRWLCDREFPVPAELAASFRADNYRITVKHVVDGDDIINVAVLVGIENQPDEIEISIPSEAVKEL